MAAAIWVVAFGTSIARPIRGLRNTGVTPFSDTPASWAGRSLALARSARIACSHFRLTFSLSGTSTPSAGTGR